MPIKYAPVSVLPLMLLLGLTLRAHAAETEYPPPPPMTDKATVGENYQRTMRLLESASPTFHPEVRVLFYGQSITNGPWVDAVADDLRKRYPHADLDIRNRSIGGFASQLLHRTAEHDVHPFYPDLVVFHVFGAHTCYETLIRDMRTRTAAEIAIWTDHVGAREKPTAEGKYVDKGWTKFMAAFLPKTAKKYDCGFIEIREPWKRYLLSNNLPSRALLKDGIHPNAHGNYLLAQLIQRELIHNPDLPLGPSEGLVKTYEVGKDVNWDGRKLELAFEGNRVDLLPTPTPAKDKAAVAVRIDGKKPSEFPGCYAYTRPSKAPGTWGPGILRVTYNERPLVEDWTVEVTEFDKAAKVFKFKVTGSKTGPDGEGVSDEDFVSDSGRVVIKARVKPKAVDEQSDWRFAGDVPVGYKIRWKSVAEFQDRYQPPAVTDATREHAATVAQDFPNGKHTLTLTAEGDGKTGLSAIRVYRPPLTD